MGKKICNVLSIIIIVMLACVAALLVVPKLFGMQGMAVLTGSMEPKIHVGAIVYVDKVDWDDIQVGDVVTYQLTADTYVTHRVVAINEDDQTVTTQGDANDSADSLPVPYSNIVGRMAFQIPYFGYVSIYSKTPLGITAICAVVLVVVLLIFLPDVISGDDPKKEKSLTHSKEDKNDSENNKN